MTSAIIILALFETYHKAIQALLDRQRDVPKWLAHKLHKLDYRKTKEAAGANATVMAACGAIALHNVNLGLWESDNAGANSAALVNDLHTRGLGPGPLLFALHTSKKQGIKGAPLVFFLRLCDGLQDWGRPKFRGRSPADREEEVLDQDISVRPSQEHAGNGPLRVLIGRGSDSEDEAKKRTEVFKESALKYLCQEDVGKIVEIHHVPKIGGPPTDPNPNVKLLTLEGKEQRLLVLGENISERIEWDPAQRERDLKTINALRDRLQEDPGAPVGEPALLKCPRTELRDCELRLQSVLTVGEVDCAGKEYEVASELLASLREVHHLSERPVTTAAPPPGPGPLGDADPRRLLRKAVAALLGVIPAIEAQEAARRKAGGKGGADGPSAAAAGRGQSPRRPGQGARVDGATGVLPKDAALKERVEKLDALLRERVPKDLQSTRAELDLIEGVGTYCRLQASLEGIEAVRGSLEEKPGKAKIRAALEAVAQGEPELLKRLDVGGKVRAELEGAGRVLRELLGQERAGLNIRPRLDGVLANAERGLLELTNRVVETIGEASAAVMPHLEAIVEASTNETRRVFEDKLANFEPHRLERHFIEANRNLPHRRRSGPGAKGR